jgi:uncharacterized protein YndB with AHSA1/START domain
MKKSVIEHSIWIDAPRARIWQAVTDPAQLAQWFLPPALGAQMKRDDQGRIYVCMGDMEVPVATFEAVDPQQVTMRGFPDQLITATYHLAEEQGGTRVTVTMDGLASLPEDARQERLGPSGAAWQKALENLKAYIEGAALPFPQGYVASLLGYRRETKETFAVERSIWIGASRERVWRAITDPKQIQQWFSPATPWRLSALEVGGRLAAYDPETDADTSVEIIEMIDPLHQLVTRSATPEAPHVTTWTLAEEAGGTRLTLTYAAYALETEDVRHQNMEQNAFGFGMLLENLQAYMEGATLPYPWGF